MKRSLIFLMALIVLCAMPVFASTPEQDMVLIVDEGDGDFSGLQQVSDDILILITGQRITDLNVKEPYWNFNPKNNEIMVGSLADEYINMVWPDDSMNHSAYLVMGADGKWHGIVDGKPWSGTNKDLFDKLLVEWRNTNIIYKSMLELVGNFM